MLCKDDNILNIPNYNVSPFLSLLVQSWVEPLITCFVDLVYQMCVRLGAPFIIQCIKNWCIVSAVCVLVCVLDQI